MRKRQRKKEFKKEQAKLEDLSRFQKLDHRDLLEHEDEMFEFIHELQRKRDERIRKRRAAFKVAMNKFKKGHFVT